MMDNVEGLEVITSNKTEDPEVVTKPWDVCPECGSRMYFAEGCMLCPVCGFARCG
jgi:anaerobic ribonucleoside-triphosphate reductase